MYPEVIILNTLSLDNAFSGFRIDLEAHYSILTALAPDAVLVGSDTAKTGVEMFYNPIPVETESDLKRPEKVPGDTRPVSVIVDSHGKLKGLLHIYRNLEHVRDVIILVSETTPADYLKYLEEREYPYLMSGYDRVDLKEAVGLLGDTLGFSRIVSDSGGRLNCILIDERIASSLSIIIAPLIAGPDHRRYFEDIDSTADLRLKKTENLKNGLVHLVYDIMK